MFPASPPGENRGREILFPLFKTVAHEGELEVEGPGDGDELCGRFVFSVSSRDRTADFLERISARSPSMV